MKDYFLSQYLQLNDFDPADEDSVLKWYKSTIKLYDKEFLPHCGKINEKKVLDLGCGIGNILYYLKHKGVNDYLGVDISEEQLAICRKYVSDKVVKADSINFLKRTAEKFDIIILYDLFEHVTKARIPILIKAIYDCLNEGGKVIVRTPNMGHPFALYSRYLDFTHEVGFTEESLSQVFKEESFSDVRVYNAYINSLKKVIIIILNKIFRKIYQTRYSRIVTNNLLLIATK